MTYAPERTLTRAFYLDPEIYALERERLFLRNWFCVGHECRIPNAGDYFVISLADESLIIVRDGQGEIHALLNVCRHRGSRVCTEAAGHAKVFVCPYHAWTYELDGRLRGARTMPEDFDKTEWGLKRASTSVVEGLILVCLSSEPPGLAEMVANLTPHLRAFGFRELKEACRRSYPIDANWKLAVENYFECYHCAPSHPEYARRHSIARENARMVELQKTIDDRATAVGLRADYHERFGLHGPAGQQDYYYWRHALYPGYHSGTEDGKAAAPLLGNLADYDGGASDLLIGPASFFLVYSDYAVFYRFTPRTHRSTDCEVTWYVRADAEAGRDYDLERLTWLWDITTRADKRIVEHNQEGVTSLFYEPGPFSRMEYFEQNFIAWYLRQMDLLPPSPSLSRTAGEGG